MQTPYWMQVSTALLTPVIAIFGCFIAYRQWRTAQNRLQLDLFEKRVAVYDAAHGFITAVLQSGTATDEAKYKFLSGIREAKWILNDEVAGYLDKEMWNKAIDLSSSREESPENQQERGEITKWFYKQIEILDGKFSPFLKLKH